MRLTKPHPPAPLWSVSYFNIPVLIVVVVVVFVELVVFVVPSYTHTQAHKSFDDNMGRGWNRLDEEHIDGRWARKDA